MSPKRNHVGVEQIRALRNRAKDIPARNLCSRFCAETPKLGSDRLKLLARVVLFGDKLISWNHGRLNRFDHLRRKHHMEQRHARLLTRAERNHARCGHSGFGIVGKVRRHQDPRSCRRLIVLSHHEYRTLCVPQHAICDTSQKNTTKRTEATVPHHDEWVRRALRNILNHHGWLTNTTLAHHLDSGRDRPRTRAVESLESARLKHGHQFRAFTQWCGLNGMNRNQTTRSTRSKFLCPTQRSQRGL
jgi:hypothetical protein